MILIFERTVIYVSTAVLVFGIVGLIAHRDRSSHGDSWFGLVKELYDQGAHHFVIVWLGAMIAGVRVVSLGSIVC